MSKDIFSSVGFNKKTVTKITFVSHGQTDKLSVSCNANGSKLTISSGNEKIAVGEDFSGFFEDFVSLTTIENINILDTSSVKDMSYLFHNCKKLKWLNLSSWDTSGCKEFKHMFDSCTNLRKIVGLENINTDNCVNFEAMFFGCKRVKTLDLSKIKKTANINRIIDGCNSLKRLKGSMDFMNQFPKPDNNLIVDKLIENGFVVVSPRTSSMYPLLRANKDQVVLVQPESIKKRDIVLFANTTNHDLIVHRVVRVLDCGLITRGDRNELCEFVPNKNIHGVASKVFKDNKTIERNSLCYNAYYCYSICYNWLAKKYHMIKELKKKVLS